MQLVHFTAKPSSHHVHSTCGCVWGRPKATHGLCCGHSTLCPIWSMHTAPPNWSQSMHSICTGGMRAGTSVQLICNSRGLQFSPPYAGSSKLGRVLDHVSLIESKPPGPETEAPSNASLKQAKFKGLLRVTKALPFAALRKLLLDNIALIAHLEQHKRHGACHSKGRCCHC